MHPSDKEPEKKGEEATVIKSKVRKVRMWKPVPYIGLVLNHFMDGNINDTYRFRKQFITEIFPALYCGNRCRTIKTL